MASPKAPTAKNAGAAVHFVTLGCAKNEVDTRDMKERIARAGLSVADSLEECDAVVVNTCSFIRPAIEESIDAVFEVAEAECVKERGVPVIVAGCMPARFGADLENELVEAAALLPCSREDEVAEVVMRCLEDARHARAARGEDAPAGPQAASADDQQPADLAGAVVPVEPAGPACPTPGEAGEGRESFAYVKISDGCDRFCSYCTIPYIRGRYHSFPLEQIEAEARARIEAGAREVTLIGQDTGLWGTDFDEPSSLAKLMEHLADTFPNTWIRAMYTQPENVTGELLDVMAVHPNIAPYLDIPMQHVVPRILEDMNRKGSAEEFSSLVRTIREKVPNAAVRTTLIAGFPGETEDDFEQLVRFVEEVEADYVGVFAYSREEGTRAYSLDGQIDEDEKAYRAERLRTVADAVSSARIASRTGRRTSVLVEGVEEDGQLFGRAIVQAPEVDGVTYVDEGEAGEVIEAEIEDTLMYDMEGSRR